MSRWVRHVRARQQALGELGEEEQTDARAPQMMVWFQDRTQVSDTDSETDFLDVSTDTAGLMGDPVPEALPVTGESFCLCSPQEELGEEGSLAGAKPRLGDCLCGEENTWGFDWVWDEDGKSTEAYLSCEDRKVSFHSDYSCGTAAVRGNRELADGQHFWEIKMTSPVYGTDMMVGIGTSEVNLEKNRHSFCSMLGADEDSWGLSYTGLLQHKGDKVNFSTRFGQGSIIGLHLDTWHGKLTFYKNRRLIGVAATKLQNKKFYPMVCSTAAKSSMKVIRACSSPTSLQYLCCQRLRQVLPTCPDTLAVLPLPPGLRHLLQTQLGWIFTLDNSHGSATAEDAGSPSNTPCPSPILSDCSSPEPDRPWLRPHGGRPSVPHSSGEDSVGSFSEPEDYQSKRCRWT